MTGEGFGVIFLGVVVVIQLKLLSDPSFARAWTSSTGDVSGATFFGVAVTFEFKLFAGSSFA